MFHSISLCAVAPDDKLRAWKSTGLILRVVVVQVLATQEEDPAIVEFDVIVQSFIIELLDLEGSLGPVSLGQKQTLFIEFTNTLCRVSDGRPADWHLKQYERKREKHDKDNERQGSS
jgi:hypothetical protein